MSVGSADLWSAIYAAWQAGGLDTLFRARWFTMGKSNIDYLTLNDGDDGPQPPLPYCVAELSSSSIKTRMSWVGPRTNGVNTFPGREFRDAMLTLNIHTGPYGSSSAKATAAYLVEEVMKVFGGHPSVSPGSMSLSNGSVLLCQFQSDSLEREPQNKYRGMLIYRLLTDVPVAM